MTAEVWPKKKKGVRAQFIANYIFKSMWFLKGHEPISKMIETT